MPLMPGQTRNAISANIRELTNHGTRQRSHGQIVAIALSNARKTADQKPKFSLQPKMPRAPHLRTASVRQPSLRLPKLRLPKMI